MPNLQKSKFQGAPWHGGSHCREGLYFSMTSGDLTIWTIGHSNRKIEEFLGLLKTHQIAFLADVRRFPGSRRYPHFNQEALDRSLGEVEIQYMHFPELGGKRKPRADSHNMAWKNLSFRGYADHIESEEFQTALRHLKDFAARQNLAVMCAEVLWWQCHRSLIADVLKSQGARVLHILGATKIEEHPYTSPAKIVDGRLSYAAEGDDGAQMLLIK
jgi:uncharacterized protein (DUF488 family)